MVHFVSGRTQGVQVKLWDPLRTRAIPERRRGGFTTRRYTNPRLPLPLPLPFERLEHVPQFLRWAQRGFLPVSCSEVLVAESETQYDCCDTPYARVTFSVHLRRKYIYYIINLLGPCIIFSILTLISLVLQPGCSDRIGLSQCWM